LQVLEGQFDDVNSVFRRVVHDYRHDEISLVSFSVVEARLFAGWGMRGIGAFELNREIEGQLKTKYGEENDGIRFPVGEWQALAMINDIKMITTTTADWKA
jgi:hypothetical protein